MTLIFPRVLIVLHPVKFEYSEYSNLTGCKTTVFTQKIKMECTRLYQSENIPKSFKEGYFF